jgi:hypothetical protein
MGLSHRSFTHTFPWFRHRSLTAHPNGFTISASLHIRVVLQD